MKLIRTSLLHHLSLFAAATAAVGCTTDGPEMSSIEAPGMLNGMLNGLFRLEGLTAFLARECPLLKQRLLDEGGLTASFPAAFASEIAKPVCERFMFYTVQVMRPPGSTLTLTAGGQPVASFPGVMNLEHLVAQAYPQYTFAQHAFRADHKIARVLATQVFGALANGITRAVSFKTDVPELDAHRAPAEDYWYRENTLLVPATPAAITAMKTEPGFLNRMPDFFNRCDLDKINVDWWQDTGCHGMRTKAGCPPPPPMPEGYCPLPVVTLGDEPPPPGGPAIPERTCRIHRPGESLPAGTTLVNGIIVPNDGDCPQVYYVGHTQGQILYDDRALNPVGTPDGCTFPGPSPTDVTDCYFEIAQEGAQLAFDRIATWRFNVEPIAQP